MVGSSVFEDEDFWSASDELFPQLTKMRSALARKKELRILHIDFYSEVRVIEVKFSTACTWPLSCQTLYNRTMLILGCWRARQNRNCNC